MSGKKKIFKPDYLKDVTVGGNVNVFDDDYVTEPKVQFNIGKKDTNIGASVSKGFSKIDKRNLNSEIGLSFTKGDEKGGFTIEGTKRGKAKNLGISFSKTFKKGGLNKWFSENWVDIGAPKKNGQFQKCGRGSSEGTKRKYPKCVPLAKATQMTKGEKASAVARKRAAGNEGPKPKNVATFTKKYYGGMIDV